MKMWRVLGALSIGIAVVGLPGCAVPVYNVKDAPVARKLTADQVRLAIMRAGATLGWQIREVKPFLLEGTLYLRSHMAKVDIPYSAQSYSILYKESANLLYDGTNIHKNYNGWIKNLDNMIKAQLGVE
jgi:hypothetical protein